MKFTAATLLAAALAIGVLVTPAAAIPKVENPVPANILEPVQFRIAFAGSKAGESAAVSWNTYGQISGEPTLRYGLDPDNLSKSASGKSTTYATSTTWNHHVLLEGLQPDTVYYYRVEGADASTAKHFKTAIAPGTNKEFQFAAAIDLGVMGEYGLSTWVGKGAAYPLKEGEKNTIDSLLDEFDNYDFLLHPGDIAYSDYWLKEQIGGYLPRTSIEEGVYVYEALLNTYYQQMEEITAYKQYMVSPGNHEANCDNGGTSDKANNITYTADICFEGQTNFTGLREHFRMPSEESGGVGPMWYSFDYGLVHYVSINTETDFEDAPSSTGMRSGEFGAPGEQLAWLRADLAKVDREKTPWVIVSGHRPWYVDAKGKNVCTKCQNAFEDIFVEYNVDLYLTGHVHLYNRMHPIAKGVIDPNGLNNPSSPWYIVNGAAGHYDGLDPAEHLGHDYIGYELEGAYGWSLFTVHNCSHLSHEFVFSENNTRVDKQTLFKDRKCNIKEEVASSIIGETSLGVNTSAVASSTASGSSSGSAAHTTLVSAKTTVVTDAETKTIVHAETSTSTATKTDCEKCHSETNGSLKLSSVQTPQTQTVSVTHAESEVGSKSKAQSGETKVVTETVAEASSKAGSSSAQVHSTTTTTQAIASLVPPVASASTVAQPVGSAPEQANTATLARISPMVMGVFLVVAPALAMHFV